MNDTNLNSASSQRGAQSFQTGVGAETTQQPQIDPKTGKPIDPKVAAQLEAKLGTLGAEELEADVMVETPETNAHLHVETRVNTGTATNYIATSGRPTIPQPIINDPKIAQQALTSTVTITPEKFQEVMESIAQTVNTINDTTPLPEDAEVVVTDSAILQLAKETRVAPAVVQRNVQTEKNAEFQELVNKLPADVANKLTFAQYVPEGAKNLDPNLQQMLIKINTDINQKVAENFGFPSDWPGVETDGTAFQTQLGVEVDQSFSKLLEAKINETGLNATDAAMLRSMFNGAATGRPDLKNILTQIQAQISTQLQAKYGVDVSYQPKGEVAFYNSVVNGDFAQTYQKNVAKYTGQATAEQKALLEKYAANPKDPSIPDSIKQLAQKLTEERALLLQAFPNPDKSSLPESLKNVAKALLVESTNAVIGKYGLDLTWQPSINSLYPPGVDPVLIGKANTALSNVQELHDRALEMVNQMPNGPEKLQFLNYLKIIGQALIAIQDAIYAMQGAQSAKAASFSKARLAAQLQDAEQQQAAADKVKHAQGKMASSGPLSKILDWMMKLTILAVGACTGPVGFAFALTYVVDSAVAQEKGKTPFMQQMFLDISKAIGGGKNAAGAGVLNLLIATTLSMVSMNPFLAMNLITQDSRFVQDFAKAGGADESEQALAAGIVAVVIQMAVMVALTVCTMGFGSGAALEKAAESLAKIADLSLKTATTIVKASFMAMQATLLSLQIVDSSIKINNSVWLSRIDIIKGNSEAYSEEIQAAIAALKKLAEKLLALLQGNSDMLVNINTTQGKKWSDASAISSEIMG